MLTKARSLRAAPEGVTGGARGREHHRGHRSCLQLPSHDLPLHAGLGDTRGGIFFFLSENR